MTSRLHTPSHIHAQTHALTRTHAYTHARTHASTHARTHTHTHTHTHAHTNTHTHTHKPLIEGIFLDCHTTVIDVNGEGAVASCPCADGLTCVADGGLEYPHGPTGRSEIWRILFNRVGHYSTHVPIS